MQLTDRSSLSPLLLLELPFARVDSLCHQALDQSLRVARSHGSTLIDRRDGPVHFASHLYKPGCAF